MTQMPAITPKIAVFTRTTRSITANNNNNNNNAKNKNNRNNNTDTGRVTPTITIRT